MVKEMLLIRSPQSIVPDQSISLTREFLEMQIFRSLGHTPVVLNQK